MATNTTIPPEEEKQPLQRPADLVMPTYAPPAPTATYEGSDQAAIMQQMIADYVSRTDPRMQAEQDAKMQRGRQFWTGANLFANVIANAINANGTAKGAPSMTWNDNASQKMYDTWRDQDKELKADRKAAQQRLDALRLQDAQFRMAEAQARDKAALDDYNKQFGLDKDAAVAKYNADMDEYKYNRGLEAQLDKEKRDNETWKERNDITYKQNLRLANIRHSGSGGRSSSKTPDNSKYSVWAGGIEIPAKNVGEHKSKSGKIVKMMVDAINKDRTDDPKVLYENPEKAKIKADDIKNWDDWIALNFEELYNSDDEFAKAFNEAFGFKNEDAVVEQPQQSKHWMDREFNPNKPYPGYLTNNGTMPTQKTPWKFPKK